MSSLTLFILCFLASCGVVAAILFLEISTFTRSNKGLQASTFHLLFFSLLLGFCGILLACCYKHFRHALAVLLGLLPVELVALFIYGLTSADADLQQTPLEHAQAIARFRQQAIARQAAITRTHPYTGRDSTQPYYTAEQMPSLTGKTEFHPEQRKSYRELAQLLSRHATPNLDPTELQPDTIPVGFTVGPYGGIFQAQIQYGEIPESGAHTRAEAAVLRAVDELPLLHPGRINGQPVSVRIMVAVPVPASR